MFYKMITKKRDIWLQDKNSVKDLIAYIEKTGQMRDAQTDAIKTYLFLKIACGNKPLYELFTSGAFNMLNLDEIDLSTSARQVLQNSSALSALFEFASQTDDDGNKFSDEICNLIKTNPDSVDAENFFKKAFYGVTYTDYLFSLPMGAGKTYLMAAFIYLDLYFAINEPENKVFAHNFIIFAPSGLKSSVVPSLRTIQKFDPSWIIPEPVASQLKRMLIFEVLDESKTAKKSNKTKNPNVQKISIHQPLNDLIGLVAVTNAEKVILDRIEEKNGQISMFEESPDEKDRQANELRNLIGKISHLSVFIDEVHHAATDEKKLRAIVNKWAQGGNVNSVIGFSGTPYLQKAEKISVADKLNISTQEIANIVYYYPLVQGIGNFLKKPVVYISDSNVRLEIIENGVRKFLDDYKDLTYPDGTCAKLGIYCGSIEVLEQQVYPLVARLAKEYNLDPSVAVLKYHGGNTEYSIPTDSAYEFSVLDKPISKKKIILLVQIGKEGWDCRSLTGIILSQEGDCSTNMVLQTSCRCLRQVQKNNAESAMIYLNSGNAKILNMQLEQQHRIDIKQFQTGNTDKTVTIKRYDRTKYLKLPPIDFYQLKIEYKTFVREKATEIGKTILTAPEIVKYSLTERRAEVARSLQTTGIYADDAERGNTLANYQIWLYDIARESFGFITSENLKEYDAQLRTVFDTVTYTKGGVKYFSSHYIISQLNSAIRKAFYDKRTFVTEEELVPEEANLLRIKNLTPEITVSDTELIYPDSEDVEKIIADDKGKLKLTKEQLDDIKMFEERGYKDIAETIKRQAISHPMKDYSFHYLPYKTDSRFERDYFEELLTYDIIKDKHLEVYYNGDRALTEFKIKCYKREGNRARYLGLYTPDFLIIQRKGGKIYKAIIIETKGEAYDAKFKDKREFMENIFTAENNKKFGYSRFDYLYIEDRLSQSERINKTIDKIKNFFTEE